MGEVLLEERQVVGVALLADDRKAGLGIVSGDPGAEAVGVVGEQREFAAARRRGGEEQGGDREQGLQRGTSGATSWAG
jgi:hypothetical protein